MNILAARKEAEEAEAAAEEALVAARERGKQPFRFTTEMNFVLQLAASRTRY